MADGGIQDILIPYNIVGQPKLARLTRLIQSGKSTLTLAADSAATVDGLSQAATTAGCRIRVIVEMDSGGGRVGTQSPADTLALAQHIDRLPGLDFTGVMTYPSSERARPFLDEVRDLTHNSGLPLHMISGGGTGSEAISKSLGCTETRIGSYAYEGMTRVGKREDLDPAPLSTALGRHRGQHLPPGASHRRCRSEGLHQLPADSLWLLHRAT